MKSKAIAVISLLMTVGVPWLPAQAQTLLKGKDLSEQNLIEALSPPEPAAGAVDAPDSGEVRLRGFRPSPVDPVKPAPSKKLSASVLITFISNSAELTDRARASLDVVARALQAERLSNFKFSIEGHADPRGDAQNNLRLSQSRAESVVGYLTGQHRISRERLKPVGKGDTEPVNTHQIDSPENRRVTIVTVRE